MVAITATAASRMIETMSIKAEHMNRAGRVAVRLNCRCTKLGKEPRRTCLGPVVICRSFLPFSLSAACLKFCQTHVTTLLQEWPAFRFRAAPPGDDPTLIDRVAA